MSMFSQVRKPIIPMELSYSQGKVIDLMIRYMEDSPMKQSTQIGTESVNLRYTIKWFKEIQDGEDTRTLVSKKRRLNLMRWYYMDRLKKDLRNYIPLSG